MRGTNVRTMAEAVRANRKKMLEVKGRHKKSARVAEHEERKMRDLSRTPAGSLLKERYEAKFEQVLNEWLAGDPGDAITAVKTHEALNRIREFVAQITPLEDSEEPDEDAGD